MAGVLETHLKPRIDNSHLKKLGVKTTRIAPGSINGGGIYVMDKPAGIEEGSIIIPLDSVPYRKFAAMMLVLALPKGQAPERLEIIREALENEEEYQQLRAAISQDPALKSMQDQIKARYEKVVAQFNKQNAPMEFEKLSSLDDQLEYVFRDEKIVKKRHAMETEDIGRVLTTVGQLHKVKSGTRYYVNEGMGGLLFSAYKKHNGINENDHFAVHIQKLIDAGNSVHMIKQDGEMVLGGSGPGVGRILKTGTGQKIQTLLHPGIVLATGGVSALLFGVGMAAWRGFYIAKNSPNAANAEAIVESLSTKLAEVRGFPSQEIDTIDGTYPDGSPKVCTIVRWTPGVRDLSERLAGGESEYSNVIFATDSANPKSKNMVKVDEGGNLIIVSQENPIKYQKIDREGYAQESTKAEYDKALAVADDTIDGLGESLLSFICMGDRDGIGKEGQNKVILPLKEPRGNKKYQFFGIDFGKSYKGKNPIIDSLDDGFNFTNPSGLDERFVNLSILYDNPLRDKMKGVYILAALRGILSSEEKEAIAADYAKSGDTLFANHLRSFPKKQNADLFLIKQEEEKYRKLASEATTDAEREQFTSYAQRISEVYKIAKKTDQKALEVFSQRLHLLPSQIDILENLEKLTAKEATTLSPDGKVRLNHIRVEKENRTPWQLEKNEDGSFNLVCEGRNLEEIKRKLTNLRGNDFIGPILRQADFVDGKLKINNLDQTDIQSLSEHLTEEFVAQERALAYRSPAERDNFHQRLLIAKENGYKPKTLLQENEEEAPVIPLLSVEQGPSPSLSLERDELTELEPLEEELAVRERNSSFTPMHERPAKKQVGFHLTPAPGANPLRQLPLETERLLVEQGVGLKQIRSYLDEELALNPDERTCSIIHYKDVKVNENDGLLVTFEKENKQTQTLIEEDKDNGEISFSADKHLNREDFVRTAAEICRIAVQTAPKNATLDVSHAPEDKRAILYELFSQEIQKAVAEGIFTVQNKPIIKGYTPPEPSMRPLFTASPRRQH